MQTHQQRQVYLITSSQADLTRFPSRQSFTDTIVEAFSKTPASVVQCVCAQESHEDGGLHYHIAIKLDRVQRWLNVKKYLADNYFITVHFSANHANYYTAWLYVTKEDIQPVESVNHPVLTNGIPPNTMNASQANIDRESNRGPRKKVKTARLSVSKLAKYASPTILKTASSYWRLPIDKK